MIIKVSNWSKHGISISNEKTSNGHHKSLKLNDFDGIGYDLTSRGVVVNKSGAALQRIDGDEFVIKPNNCVVLETKEYVATGSKVFGQICSRASLAAKGLIVSNLKVDPNYSDSLYITVFNAGKENIRLKVGGAFCTLFFSIAASDTKVKASKPDADGLPESIASRIKQVFPHIMTYLAAVVTILATLIGFF